MERARQSGPLPRTQAEVVSGSGKYKASLAVGDAYCGMTGYSKIPNVFAATGKNYIGERAPHSPFTMRDSGDNPNAITSNNPGIQGGRAGLSSPLSWSTDSLCLTLSSPCSPPPCSSPSNRLPKLNIDHNCQTVANIPSFARAADRQSAQRVKSVLFTVWGPSKRAATTKAPEALIRQQKRKQHLRCQPRHAD